MSLTSVLTPKHVSEVVEVKLTDKPSKISKVRDLQCLCPVQQIWKIEIGDVVPDDHVRIGFLDEFPPLEEQLPFILELDNLRSDDVCTRVESKHILYERFGLA